MRFTHFLMAGSALAVAAMATPHTVKHAHRAEKAERCSSTGLSAAELAFAAEQSECSVFKCAEVILDVVCIAAGMATADVSAVVACAAGGSIELCPCAACIADLDDFLKKNDVCPSL